MQVHKRAEVPEELIERTTQRLNYAIPSLVGQTHLERALISRAKKECLVPKSREYRTTLVWGAELVCNSLFLFPNPSRMG
jgi:hypothetical protein